MINKKQVGLIVAGSMIAGTLIWYFVHPLILLAIAAGGGYWFFRRRNKE